MDLLSVAWEPAGSVAIRASLSASRGDFPLSTPTFISGSPQLKISSQMNNWSKESLKLIVGDQIIWQDAEIKSEDGFAIVSLGMKGQVISLHDGFQMDQVQEGSVPLKALVRFENGISLLVDHKMKWERLTEE